MKDQIHLIRKTREKFLQLLDSLSPEAINKIPENFNNNIIWNFGHIIVAQQILCYRLSGNDMNIDKQLTDKYLKGSKPEGNATAEEVGQLKKLAEETILQLEADLKKDLFLNFKTYTTSYGVELHSIEDAIRFISVHEGLHLGYAMALKRAIG